MPHPDTAPPDALEHSASPVLWSRCRLGYPEPERCPDCTPPTEDRCPESTGGRPCRVLGPHRTHLDGAGTSWRPMTPAELAELAELEGQ